MMSKNVRGNIQRNFFLKKKIFGEAYKSLYLDIIGPMGLVDVCVSWFEHPRLSNKKIFRYYWSSYV